MEALIISIFFLGYLIITLEHNLKIDKIIPALAMMSVLWALVSFYGLNVFEVNSELKELETVPLDYILLHHLGKTAEILFFLIGAMTIVEIIDYFDGFASIKSVIKTRSKRKLLWIFVFLSFMLSAVIDNLTATIVIITILQKIIRDKNTRFWYAGMVIIAANAGGAWSPIGDVTTTMLWISKKVTSFHLIEYTLIPSILCALVPTLIVSRFSVFKGNFELENKKDNNELSSSFMLYLGIGAIIFVPIFKALTGLPPYMGMALSLSVVCLFAEIRTHYKFAMTTLPQTNEPTRSPIHYSMSNIEFSSIMFFFGILMSVAALESLGQLFHFAESLNHAIPNTNIVIMLLGVASAVIDNVPLVAASIGMFSQPLDNHIWHLLAFSAGTGGSILIIGSASGVVAMGMEKIAFFNYLKKISLLAIIGFLSGYLFMVFTM